jgi:hypothetical protein
MKNTIILQSQSTFKYNLLKDLDASLYYVVRIRDNKKALLGDKEEALDFILYGIAENKEDLKTLKFE